MKGAVLLFGITASGSKRWVNLYFLNLQPSELMKIAKTGIIKRQNASRNVSRITKKIASL